MGTMIDEYLRAERVDNNLPLESFKPVASFTAGSGGGGRRTPPDLDLALFDDPEESDEDTEEA